MSLLLVYHLEVDGVVDVYLCLAVRAVLLFGDEHERCDGNPDNNQRKEYQKNYAAFPVGILIVTHLNFNYTLRFLACKAETVSSVRARA